MSNPWFRMYAEFAHDPRVQMLSEVMQRRYVMLMCMRCSELLVTLHVTEIAFHMRITDAELDETKAMFLQRGFIDEDWNLLNWEKRQFATDSSAERVARHRAKKKQGSNGACNVTETKSNVLDTDTDTDTEDKKHSAQSADCSDIPAEQPAKPAKEPRPEYLSANDLIAAGLSQEVAVELHALRKRKRAPLTPRAWEGMCKEFEKAGMPAEQGVRYLLDRGWQSFEASWVKNGQAPRRESPHILPDNSVHTADAAKFDRRPPPTAAEMERCLDGML